MSRSFSRPLDNEVPADGGDRNRPNLIQEIRTLGGQFDQLPFANATDPSASFGLMGPRLTTPSLKLTADQNDAQAQFNYGFCLETGCGVAADLIGAAKSYQLVADQSLLLLNYGVFRESVSVSLHTQRATIQLAVLHPIRTNFLLNPAENSHEPTKKPDSPIDSIPMMNKQAVAAGSASPTLGFRSDLISMCLDQQRSTSDDHSISISPFCSQKAENFHEKSQFSRSLVSPFLPGIIAHTPALVSLAPRACRSNRKAR
jgi:hypothetical protein